MRIDVVRQWWRVLSAIILNILAPPFCACCRSFLSQRSVFCDSCSLLLKPVPSVRIFLGRKHAIPVFAAAAYQDPIRHLILAKIYGNRAASRQLGQLIWEGTCVSTMQFDYIVPVPLHWRRYARRGYNQAHEMAVVIAHKSGKPILSLLERVVHCPYQASLAGDQRRINVADVFRVRDQYVDAIKDKHVLLVDDVMTTGETLRSAAHTIFMDSRSTIVSAVVAARAI